MTSSRNTRSFWEGKDYEFWERAAPGEEAERIPWATWYFLRSLLPVLEGKTVLDLGCGPGYLTPYLASACRSVVGVDFSSKALEAARKRCSGLENASFLEGNVLDLQLEDRFDVITGRMFLHEIMHEDTPRFLDWLDARLTEGGFLVFHENSYFNPAARFIRRRLVGRFGIPKHGSDQELPFDADRFAMYRDRFRYCDRYVEAVEFIQKLYHYFVPVQRDWLGRPFVVADRMLTRLQARTGWLDDWSYVQTVYASQTRPRSEVFPGPGASRRGQEADAP